jgi:hypothetical protein
VRRKIGRVNVDSGDRAFRNHLRDLNIVVSGSIAGLSVGFGSLFAVLILKDGDPPIEALGLLTVAVLVAVVMPLANPSRDTPAYLLLWGGALWAVYGKPHEGRSLRLPWESITKLELGPAYVQVRSQSPEAPRRTLIFNVQSDSYPELTAARSVAVRGAAL